MDLSRLLSLLQAPLSLTWQSAVMMAVGGVLIYLAIAKDYEPMLLLPIGFGAILTNLPLTGIAELGGLLGILYKAGIQTELFPLLIFIGVGAMTDFGPLLENPKMALLGAAGQLGIFGTLMLALALGFNLNESASIGIIGAIDGPTAIYVSTKLAPHLLGPIAVAAYSYMSLVPIIQPPIMRLLTTDAERVVRLPYSTREVARPVRILFPIVVTIIVSLIAPVASPLIAALMFGNLMREIGRGRASEQVGPERDRQCDHHLPRACHWQYDDGCKLHSHGHAAYSGDGPAGLHPGYGRRGDVRKADVRAFASQVQSPDRRRRHQRLSDVGAHRPAYGARIRL